MPLAITIACEEEGSPLFIIPFAKMLQPARLGEHLPSPLVLPSPVTCQDEGNLRGWGSFSLHRMSFLRSLDPHEAGGSSPFTVALVVLVKTNDGE
ncbi:hypothetical protein PHLCEN_2v9919, partial [Hermanssonia centrifuga]